jgi:phospholipase/carboxylesterase
MAPDSDILALDPTSVLWSVEPAAREGRPLLVLLHGYGADEEDLFGLIPHLPDAFAVAAPRAPLSPPWPAPGYSWYPIEERGARDPDRVTAAARGVLAWLEAEAPGARVGLLGFSQGAAVALQALRLAPARIEFAVNLSGYVAPGSLPTDAALAARRPPVFWGRGTNDDVIPAALVAHTTEWLPGFSTLSGRVYPGLTHAVSEQELIDVRTFLEMQLEPAPAPAPAPSAE